MDRRQFMYGLTASGVLLAGGKVALSAGASHTMTPAEATADFKPDIELELNAVSGEAGLLSGNATRLWRYTGRVLHGNAQALGFLDGSGHIPVIRARRGQKLRIRFNNHLPEDSIVHWHGLHITQRMDGHPMYAIPGGKTYVYEFMVDNRAGTYWFHPHPHGRTGHQVYYGLSGLFLVGDEEEDAARLPADEFDIAAVIQDRSFDPRNQFVYIGRGMMDRMMGFSGQRVLVNGSPDYRRDVSRSAYRLRLFNGSNATLYRLRRSDGRPFTVIATDGGLLEQPMERDSLTLATGERADVWVDFSAHQPGEELALVAESFAPDLENITRSQTGAALLKDGHPIMRLRVTAGAARKAALPQRLSMFPRLDINDATNRDRPRTIRMSMMRGQLMLNGRTFGDDMMEVAADEKVKLGATEIWDFANDASFGMAMAHPMHVHNLQFRVIGRSGTGGGLQRELASGFTDEGLKDVVLVMPGERVRVLMKFENHTGLYLYHCHILEHEDMGMMRNYLVQA